MEQSAGGRNRKQVRRKQITLNHISEFIKQEWSKPPS